MKALVYLGPGKKAVEERPKPEIEASTDAIVKISKTTICGTDLHILKGDVATCQPGRVLGHEGTGVIDQVGAGVTAFKPGECVLISCISACGKCMYCRKLMYSHCVTGGWILGNKIDGTQAEFVRIPHADTSLYRIPDNADEEALVMLSDILPTGFECGVLNGKVQPGSTVAIVGSGPIGLAALLTARFYSPAEIIVVDLDDSRLETAKRFGATAVINNADGNAVKAIMKLTSGRGVDTAIEAVGIPRHLRTVRGDHRAGRDDCERRRAWREGRSSSGAPVGPEYHDHHAARRHREYADAAGNVALPQARSQTSDYPSFHIRADPRCVRNLRARGRHPRAQGDHRGLARRAASAAVSVAVRTSRRRRRCVRAWRSPTPWCALAGSGPSTREGSRCVRRVRPRCLETDA